MDGRTGWRGQAGGEGAREVLCWGHWYAHLEFFTQTKSHSYTLTQTSSSQFQPVEPKALGFLVYPYHAIKNKNINTVHQMYKVQIINQVRLSLATALSQLCKLYS